MVLMPAASLLDTVCSVFGYWPAGPSLGEESRERELFAMQLYWKEVEFPEMPDSPYSTANKSTPNRSSWDPSSELQNFSSFA